MADLRSTIQDAMNAQKAPEDDNKPVGLAANPPGVAFHCGECKYFDNGTCQNENPKLNGRPVDPEWCCNLYEHDGMETIID